jgi:AcrR family transcriptional regulator
MHEPPPARRRARSRRAIGNDERIIRAARATFIADPRAPVSAVARAAGLGISALYSRYPSKEALLRAICHDGLDDYIEAARQGLATDDPRAGLERFMEAVVDADTHSLTLRLAGTFAATTALRRRAEAGRELAAALLERAQRAGAIRADLVIDDLSFIFEQVASVRGADTERTEQLRRRYLQLALDGLAAERADRPLPGPPPTWDEIAARWST